ncbi:MAG: efflux RND transporter periplasmic adaptor subunit [Flavobacteriaceae bacterium]|nr:efflux RND transporter periplasmic adaptor subunit [Flavobacteriaceae bacterium]
MKKYIYIITLISSTLLITSCGSEDKKIAHDNSPVINVKVKKVTPDNNQSFLSVSGKIQASNSAEVSTRIMGYVEKVHVNVGDKVKKGQLLVSINNNDLQAKKAQVDAGIIKAETAFKNAEKNYNRFKNLYSSQSVSQKEMDDMTANYQISKASLESAKQMKNEINAQFAYANITAPFNGVITNKNIKSGDMANPGMPLLSLESPKNFEVLAMVPETEISKIKKDITVNVLVKSIDKTIKGKVTEVSSSAKNTGGQYLVKIALEKTNTNVLSGMFATVEFPINKEIKSKMILIPNDALVKNGQLSGVYTVSQSNTALLRWLLLGRTYGDQVEVLSGLSANENYIISADSKLFNGAKISIQ